MYDKKPTAYDVIREVSSLINKLGVEASFYFVGKMLLYSGPNRQIRKVFRTTKSVNFNSNHAWVKEYMRFGSYSLIDDTKIASRLINYGGPNKSVYKFFNEIYGAEKSGPGDVAKLNADKVMGFVSRAFMFRAQGDVETLVCGAGMGGIFFTKEIPALMENRRVTSINGVPMERFRNIYFSGHPDAAYQTYRKICQAQLALTRRRIATAETKDKKEAMKSIHNSSRAFFFLERKERLKPGYLKEVLATSPLYQAQEAEDEILLPGPYKLRRATPPLGHAAPH